MRVHVLFSERSVESCWIRRKVSEVACSLGSPPIVSLDLT